MFIWKICCVVQSNTIEILFIWNIHLGALETFDMMEDINMLYGIFIWYIHTNKLIMSCNVKLCKDKVM